MRIIVLSFMLLLASKAFSQQLSGIAQDVDGTPISGATISLLKAKDSSIVKLTLSKDKGSFSFSPVAPGNYLLNISHVGYQPIYTGVISMDQTALTVPALILKKVSGDMRNIVVTARKPLVEVKADKMILNVEGTMNATGSDALELLRRSPGVSIDKDDNLSLAGKNGVQIYVDNRPTPLAGQDLANYLKTLQSSQIEVIEIITNPSAKYEAAGNAGIINIRLKKNKAFGTNGSVSAGYNQGNYPKYNGSLNLNNRNKNVNLYGTYSINQLQMLSEGEFNRSIVDTSFKQTGRTKIDILSHNFKAGIDYTLNKTSTIGAIINGSVNSIDLGLDNGTLISYEPTNTPYKTLLAANTINMDRNNYNLNLNYGYTGTGGKTLTLNADKGYFDNNNSQYQPNTYYDATGQTKLNSVVYEMHSPTKININSGKVDYEQDFQKGKLGIGGKIAFINTDNDFKRYDVLSTGKQLDKDRSNLFTYKENINAGYVNYNRPFKSFMLQAGLRVENTVTEGISDGLKKEGSGYVPAIIKFKRNYVDFFPSAALSFNKNPMNQWNVTYSRRIDRPAYQDLNPFEFKSDEYTTSKGNVNLLPQYTNSIGLSNTYKYKLNTAFNYSHVSNLFTQLLDTIEKSKAINTKRNHASQDIVSLNISYPFIYKTLTVFGNVNSFYTMYKADFGNGRMIDLNSFGMTFVTQSSLKFAKTYTAEMTTFYVAPTIMQGTFRSKAIYGVDAGLSKVIFAGKGTIKAAVSDIFHTMKFNGTSEFAGQKILVTQRWESQMVKLNLSYRFGNLFVKPAKQKTTGAEDELKRAQQDNPGGGIGKQ